MSLIGLSSQNGTINDFPRVVAKKPIAWLLLGNAVGLQLARDIRAASPLTQILLRTGGDWAYKDDAWNQAYLDHALAVAEPFQREGLCDSLTPPNEPVVQDAESAKILNDRQVWYAGELRKRGYATGAYNFSVGNPDYPLWPHLQDGIRACGGWLFLHQYDVGAAHPEIYADTSLRHRKVLPLLAPDVRAMLKIGFTECLIDLNTRGEIYGHGGGFGALPDNGHLIEDYCAHLDWWDAELAKDTYVKFATIFGYSMLEPWVDSLKFDVARVDTERAYFVNWLKGGAMSPIPPTLPPAGVPTAAQIVDAAWHSIGRDMNANGIDYNPDAAFVKTAIALAPDTAPVGKETDFFSGAWRLQCFDKFILACKIGDWGNIKPYNRLTGAPWTASQPPTTTPPTGATRLTVIPPQPLSDESTEMVNTGFIVVPYVPKAGEEFYGLIQCDNFKFGVGTEAVVTVRGPVGTLPGVPVTQAFDPERIKTPTQTTDGAGQRKVGMGHGDDFTPPAMPPDRIYCSLGDGIDGQKFATPKGDILVCGQVGGHTSWNMTFQKMIG